MSNKRKPVVDIKETKHQSIKAFVKGGNTDHNCDKQRDSHDLCKQQTDTKNVGVKKTGRRKRKSKNTTPNKDDPPIAPKPISTSTPVQITPPSKDPKHRTPPSIEKAPISKKLI